VRFGRMQKAEIQATTRFGRQSVMQSCFTVVSMGRPFELIGVGRMWRRVRVNPCAGVVDIQRFILSHDDPI
jgi:hypothetical protein